MDLLEKIAEQLHFGWMQYKLSKGFEYGPYKCDKTKTHPHLLSWPELVRKFQDKDLEVLNQDRFQAALILDGRKRGEVMRTNLAETIHNAWARWEKLNKKKHAHAVPFKNVHAKDQGEHRKQADLVWPLIRYIKKSNQSV